MGISETQIPDTSPQKKTFQGWHDTNQQKKQQSIGSNEDLSQDQQVKGLSENTEKQYDGENMALGENKKNEAATIWAIAKKLGVNAEEDNGRMEEKFMAMEERDRNEAEKWGISAISHEHCHIQCEGVREGGKMGSNKEVD